MKQKTPLLLMVLILLTTQTGCIKEIFKKKKKEEPESKYYGTWKAVQLGVDQNQNNILDNNEYFAFTGTSEMVLNGDKQFTYSLITNTGNSNMSGNWSASADLRTITITDASQGNLRFDYRSDTQFQTEPIPTGTGNAWLIYNKQ